MFTDHKETPSKQFYKIILEIDRIYKISTRRQPFYQRFSVQKKAVFPLYS